MTAHRPSGKLGSSALGVSRRMAALVSKRSAAFERETAGGGFVEDDSERPEIAAVIGGFSAQNFRRHVGERAADAGATLHRCVGSACRLRRVNRD